MSRAGRPVPYEQWRLYTLTAMRDDDGDDDDGEDDDDDDDDER